MTCHFKTDAQAAWDADDEVLAAACCTMACLTCRCCAVRCCHCRCLQAAWDADDEVLAAAIRNIDASIGGALEAFNYRTQSPLGE
jgi:hypothetical protein